MLRGVFWVVDGKLLAFSFREGAQIGVAKSGNTYNHRLLWEHVKLQGSKKPFDYYPRGRVEINRQGVPILYMNPNIQDSMLSEIMAAFELRVQPVIRYDHSRHYHCYLDKEAGHRQCYVGENSPVLPSLQKGRHKRRHTKPPMSDRYPTE